MCFIDEEEGIYFVRSTWKGQDFKVHVNIKTGSCSNTECNLVGFEDSVIVCRHVRSSRAGNLVDCNFYNLSDEQIEQTRFSVEKKNALKNIQEAADEDQKPLISEWSESKDTSRHFSVYSSKSDRVYLKVMITPNSSNWKCDTCSKETTSNCVQIYAAMCVAQRDSEAIRVDGSSSRLTEKYIAYAR